MKEIDSYAFSGDKSLTTLVLPDSLKIIRRLAFDSGLQSVFIPESVEIVAQHAFWSIDGLTIFCEAATRPDGWKDDWNFDNRVVWGFTGRQTSINGLFFSICFDSAGNECATLMWPETDFVDLEIPNFIEVDGTSVPVTRILDYAFYDCDSLNSVVLPSNIEDIGNFSFYSCSNLSSLEFAPGIQIDVIPQYAFTSCISLKSLVLPSGLIRLEDGAFWSCTGLEWIELPGSVEYIGFRAFAACSSLQTVNFVGESHLNYLGILCFASCPYLSTFFIPASVVYVGEDSFMYCFELTIYCEFDQPPTGWDDNWNSSGCPVVWGYTQGNSTI